MSRRFSFVPCMLAATLALSLSACGGHKAEDVELTPAQQMAKLRAQPGVTVLKMVWLTKFWNPAPKMVSSPARGML